MDIDALRRGAENPAIATVADLPAVANDLADAFTGDVMLDWLLRDDARRDEARERLFALVVSLARAQGGRIERPAGGGAAAMWLPFESIGPLPLASELRAFPTLLFATGLGRFGRLAAWRAALDKNHPADRPHAYLWFFGVRREAQGRGIGSRLLKAATDRLDGAGQAAFLETETERNVALYERHGFVVTSQYHVRPDAPPMWSMWRDPMALEPEA